MKKLLSTIGLIFALVLSSNAQQIVKFVETKRIQVPLIEIDFMGEKCIFIYDTGASMTIINAKELKNFPKIKEHTDMVSVSGISFADNIRCTDNIFFTMGEKYAHTFGAIKDVDHIFNVFKHDLPKGKRIVGILGMDIISELGINADVINRQFVIYSPQKKAEDRKIKGEEFAKLSFN